MNGRRNRRPFSNMERPTKDKCVMNKYSVMLIALAVTALMTGIHAGGAVAADRPGLISLELPIGPRAIGMGSAFTSIADDVTAMYWNPAGLTRLTVADKHFDLMFQHNEWIADFRQEFIGGGTRVGKHAFGGSFSGFYANDLDGRDEFGQPTTTFGAYDAVLTGSYAYAINPRLSAGVSAKYIVANIEDITHFAFAFDVGGQYEVRPDLWIGGAVTNLGSGITFVSERDDLPTAFQFGASYLVPKRLGNGSFLVAADVRKTRGIDDTHLLIGAEYDYAAAAQFQIGYRSGFDNDDINFGIGTQVSLVRLNYAFVPFGSDLGNTHRIAFGLRL